MEKKKALQSCFVLFSLFFVVALLFPYMGDDWTWGSDAGMAYLKNFFADYNGRYAGNLLVMALTRSKLLDAFVMATSYVLVCYFCYEYTENKNTALIWVAAILFFFMPKEIWAQTIVWTSGYSNYVPSALISVYVLISSRKIWGKNPLTVCQKPGRGIVMFALGVSGALFVENITIFNICLSAGMILYAFARFRKYFIEDLGFFFGAMIGACIMFSNSAYHIILEGDDYYRGIPRSFYEIVDYVLEHAQAILTYLIYDNPLICGIVTFLLMLLALSCEKRNDVKERTMLSFAELQLGTFLLICYKDKLVGLLKHMISMTEQLEMLLDVTVALAFVGCILLMVLRCVEDDQKPRILLPLFCIVVSLAPLLVVNPIGPRCVFIGYFLMMVFVTDLVAYLRIRLIPDERWMKRLACLTVVMQFLVCLCIFYPVHYYDAMRTDLMKKQREAGKKSIWICELPNNDYLWNSTPVGNNLPKRYKLFYGLDESIELELVSYEDMEALANEYR